MFIDEIKFLVQIKSSVPKEVFAEQILASSIVDQMYLPLFEKNEIGILVICDKIRFEPGHFFIYVAALQLRKFV